MLKNHPKGLLILFFSELWERFSFYGMRSLLVLYMTKELLYGDKAAYGVYGAYGALVYAMPVIGGLLADRVLGNRRAIILGGLLMALGHFCMAVSQETFFYGALALLCIGNGFFKPNISSLVGKLYTVGDTRRDAGFTIFYMGINAGAFLSPIVCGVIGEKFGWHYGFGIAGVGMLLGLACFIKGSGQLEGKGEPPSLEKLTARVAGPLSAQNVIYIGCAILVPVIGYAIYQNSLVGNVLSVVGSIALLWLLYTAFTATKEERDRLLVLIVLMFFHMTFWAFFEQAGSSLTLFADRNVNLSLFGFETTASLTQSLNPMFIIILAPFFSAMWAGLQNRGLQPSVPGKFVLGILQVGLGFAALVFGAQFADQGKTAYIWLALAYLLHTTGELCISPVGLSAVTKLAPAKVVSTVMGCWFLTISFAHHIAGAIAKLTGGSGDTEAASEGLDAVATLPIYSGVFWEIFVVSTGAALLLLVLSPVLKKWMHGVK